MITSQWKAQEFASGADLCYEIQCDYDSLNALITNLVGVFGATIYQELEKW